MQTSPSMKRNRNRHESTGNGAYYTLINTRLVGDDAIYHQDYAQSSVFYSSKGPMSNDTRFSSHREKSERHSPTICNSAQPTHDVSGLKWVIGTPYFVQGTSNLSEIPILYFIKFGLGLGDPGGQLFDSLRNAGWFIKPVWGYLSDRVALFGYYRKSWFVLMAFLAVLFWTLNALLTYFDVRFPAVYLLTFNLAFATYAFVDVVCDALMVTYGRKLQRVGSFVNFQWTVLAIANAGAIFLGGWLQQQVQAGELSLALIFFATGVPPLFTAIVGLRYIDEERKEKHKNSAPKAQRHGVAYLGRQIVKLGKWIRDLPERIRANRTILLLALFIFFWKFSPSIGYIERSYLIDVRGFTPASFGVILSVGSLTFLFSLMTYRWVVHRFSNIVWYQYLYAMVALGLLAFPLSFYLYLDPHHPWWEFLFRLIPKNLSLIGGWNRYEWFRLISQTVLGFASIPAFIIPLTIAGEIVDLEHAGMGYAFLMALANVTDMLEGAIGALLYRLMSQPTMHWFIEAFHGSLFDIAGVNDERTLILQIFVYISLIFTLLTLPFITLLRREFARRGISIQLANSH